MSEQGTRYPGVYVAMSTPLTAERRIDRTGVRRVVDYLLGAGIDGLSILGTTGECSSLARDQRREMLEATLEAAGERGTVFTGVAGTALDEVIADLKAADLPGVRGVLVPPPYYYPLDLEGIVDFFERVAEASPLPVILYNIPRMTKNPIPPPAVARLSEHPNVMGIKDSSGEFAYYTQVARIGARADGFTVYTGADMMFAAALYVGGHGIIGGGVNLAPELMVALYRAHQAGDRGQVLELQARVSAAVEAVRGIGVFPAGYKAQYALKGLCEPYPARPVPPLGAAEMALLRERMIELGILSA